MFEFSFTSNFENKQELEKELKQLLLRIQHTWPVIINSNDMKWTKSHTDENVIKLNYGLRQQTLSFKK